MAQKSTYNMGIAVQDSLSFLLPIFSRFLPLEDEIGSRSLNVVNACMRNHSSLVRAVVNYDIYYGCYSSFLGIICCFVQEDIILVYTGYV